MDYLAVTKNRVGEKFGLLTIVSMSANGKHSFADCICECGVRKTIRADHVISGRQVSCGCKRRTTHGMHKTRTYATWLSMRNRCLNPSNTAYSSYGGRGIGICPRWDKFENFLSDMGEKPPGMSLDRKDNDGNYEPTNCRWATQKEQQNNTRSTVMVHFQGVRMSLMEAIAAAGSDVPSKTVRARLRAGWDLSRALGQCQQSQSGCCDVPL